MKKLIRLHEKSGEKFALHAFIHDEIICEVHKDHLTHIEKNKKLLRKKRIYKNESKS